MLQLQRLTYQREIPINEALYSLLSKEYVHHVGLCCDATHMHIVCSAAGLKLSKAMVFPGLMYGCELDHKED